jgi:hypothetical protein
MRKVFTAIALAFFVGFAAPNAAQAQVEQDGLVNLNIGDITIQDINIQVAAQIIANVCAIVDVDAVVGILSDIDVGDLESYNFCRIGEARGPGRGPELVVTNN